MGGPLHSRSRSRNRKSHHQKCSRKDAGCGQGEVEESHRGKRRHRLRTGQDLHGGNMAGSVDGELRQGEIAPVHLQNLTRLSEKPHQAADRQHPADRPDFSGLAAVLQASAGRWPSRPHRSEKETERSGSKDRPEHPSDDLLGIQPCHGTAARHEKSHTGLCVAKSRTQRDENADRRPTQRLLPRSQGQWCVRALLPRPRHRTSAG